MKTNKTMFQLKYYSYSHKQSTVTTNLSRASHKNARGTIIKRGQSADLDSGFSGHRNGSAEQP